MKHDESSHSRITAVALQFDGTSAPIVSAKGTGITAEHIIQLAREHGIPLHENGGLAHALSHIPLGEEIPVEVYTAVAEVLAYLYYLDDLHRKEREAHVFPAGDAARLTIGPLIPVVPGR